MHNLRIFICVRFIPNAILKRGKRACLGFSDKAGQPFIKSIDPAHSSNDMWTVWFSIGMDVLSGYSIYSKFKTNKRSTRIYLSEHTAN